MKIKEIKEETALVEMDFKTLLQVATSLGITIDENNQEALLKIHQCTSIFLWLQTH